MAQIARTAQAQGGSAFDHGVRRALIDRLGAPRRRSGAPRTEEREQRLARRRRPDAAARGSRRRRRRARRPAGPRDVGARSRRPSGAASSAASAANAACASGPGRRGSRHRPRCRAPGNATARRRPDTARRGPSGIGARRRRRRRRPRGSPRRPSAGIGVRARDLVVDRDGAGDVALLQRQRRLPEGRERAVSGRDLRRPSSRRPRRLRRSVPR